MSDFNGVPAEDDSQIVETSGDGLHSEFGQGDSLVTEPESLSGAPTISTPMPPPPPPSANVKSQRKLRSLAKVVVVIAVGFGSGILGTIAADKWNITIGSTTISGSSNTPLVTSEVGSDDPSLGATLIAQVVNKLTDSVVTINSQVNDESGQGEASGTGVVLTSDGEILTNAHVVAGSTSVTVRFAG
jgi:putative serine protease PepD